jgi:predicted amidohydrolase
MLNRIGLFHFGINHKDPIGELQSAMHAENDISDSLIVLPEGFNIGKYYWSPGVCDYGSDVVSQLQDLSRTSHVAFVAGLIIKETNGPQPPYSSVYLIDGCRSTPVCYKEGDDGSRNYTPDTGNGDINNPIQSHENVCIGALICMDAVKDERVDARRDERHQMLCREIDRSNCACRVVCIPGCMDSNHNRSAVAKRLGAYYVVLANSHECGCGSFISKNGGIVKDVCLPENRICTVEVGVELKA